MLVVLIMAAWYDNKWIENIENICASNRLLIFTPHNFLFINRAIIHNIFQMCYLIKNGEMQKKVSTTQRLVTLVTIETMKKNNP